jgi:hypothetical protein
MPISPFATRPFCLDSEYLPRPLLRSGISGLTEEVERERGKAAYREFIRSLIFSPQVVVGREATVGHPVLAQAVKDARERDALVKLFEKDRLYVLLMVSRGNKGDRYQEQSLLDFFDHSRFRADAQAVQHWREVTASVGDLHIPYLRLDAVKSQEMENRFTSFFKIAPGDPALLRVFSDALGRTAWQDEVSDLQSFWREDLRQFTRWREDEGQDSLYRSSIYDEYIRPKEADGFLASVRSHSPAKASELEARRKRLRIPLKLITDLAYNANTPTTLGIKSFVPPEHPDPAGLPRHLFQSQAYWDAEAEQQREAVRNAFSEVVARRTEAGERFFYETQTYERLPDIGSFTLRDAVAVMDWPEWQAFKMAQHATMRFQRAEELESLMRDYWITVKQLHNRLEREAKNNQRWRWVGRGGIVLSMAVVCDIMGHVLLPDFMNSVPWWATVASSTAVAQSIHAGIEIVVHGLQLGTKSVLTEIGFKDGGMRDFFLSPEMQDNLADLKAAEERLSETRRLEDATVASAANQIATEG